MEKKKMREMLKEKRASVSVERKKELDRAIVERIEATEQFQNASMLLLYAPLAGEINLLPLVRAARSKQIPVAFPRCNVQENTMQFCFLAEDARLSAGAYGIPEPPEDAPLCVPDANALCILPALSFDLCGNRIGYGKGYYDRYLKDFPGVTVGAVYTAMLVRQIPTEAHDIPVQFVVSEEGVLSCTDTAKQSTPPPLGNQPKSTQPMSVGVRLKGVWESYRQWEEHTDCKPLHTPPLLVLAIFLLLFAARLIDTQWLTRENAYIGVILLQILIFLIPAALYCKLKGDSFLARIRMKPPRLSQLFFILCMLMVMISGSLLASILTGGISTLSGNFTLYGTFVARTSSPLNIIYAIIAYAILPALGEELVFRSILCAEYEGRGIVCSVSVSAFFFALLHFSIPLFFTYTLLGALLALSMYATRSFFTPFLLHLCYNIFCLFGQPYLSAFYVQAGGNEIFLFCVVVIFLLFAALAAGEARKIYHLYAKRNVDSSYTVPLSWRVALKKLFYSLLTPSFAVCLLAWMIALAFNLLS